MSLFDDFRTLEARDSAVSPFNVIPVPEREHRLGMTNEGYPIFFVVNKDESVSMPPLIRELLTVDFNIQCKLLAQTGTEEKSCVLIILKSSDVNLQRYFIDIFAMMLQGLPPEPSQVELSVEIERLITIFSSLKNAPVKKIQGLWAELLVIEQSLDPSCIAKAWHNNPSSKYDFSSGRDKIEVKSTSSELRKHRFSLDQLNPSENSTLIISSVIVRETSSSSSGLSVTDLYHRICKRVPDTETKIHINEVILNTLKSDYEKADKVYFDYTEGCDSMRFYNYIEVPKISKDSVPAGVSELKFLSDLSSSKSLSRSELHSCFEKGEIINFL